MIELGNYNEVIETLIPVIDIIEANYIKRPLIMAYVKSGKFTELDNFLSEDVFYFLENLFNLHVFCLIDLKWTINFEVAFSIIRNLIVF